MNVAVRYYTKTGNTKRLAEAVAEALGVKAYPISEPIREKTDILFVNFGSAAMLNSTYKKVKAEADKAGIPMDEREFHCKGEFKGIHKGKPDADDLKAAADFAKQIVG